jgi:hypothetical protein
MLLQKFKTFLATPKNSVLYEPSQRTVFFATHYKEQYLKADISLIEAVIRFRVKFNFLISLKCKIIVTCLLYQEGLFMNSLSEISFALEQLRNELEVIAREDVANLKQDLSNLETELASIERKEISNSAEALHSLVLDLEKIERKEFSFLKTLRIEGNELVHSNFLAWLLDPSGNHGLGPLFTEKFLAVAVQKVKNRKIDLSGLNFFDIVVEREISSETSRLDIRLMDAKGLLHCAIENKILSKEGTKQTRRLYNDFHGICPRELFIFLTLTGAEKPDNKNFVPMTYNELRPILTELLDVSVGDTNFLIKNYLNTLERLIMAEKFNGYSERTQLYFRYVKQIQEIKAAYEADRRLMLSALEDGIKQREWWDESTWKMDKTGSDIKIFKPIWVTEDTGVYFWLTPWIEQPGFDLSVYGRPSAFSLKFVTVLKKNLERKYPDPKMAGDFKKNLSGINTYLEKDLHFSFTEKNQIEKILKSLDEMVEQFEKILDESVEEFKKKLR